MEEARNLKTVTKDTADGKSGGAASPPRDAEATSSETLSDVEKGEKATSAGASGAETGSSLEGASPNPAPDGGGRADGSDSGGPM